MAIFIPTPLTPREWTRESWRAYKELHHATMEYIEAYRATIGIFALFSPTKNRRLRDKQTAYRALLKRYNDITFGK